MTEPKQVEVFASRAFRLSLGRGDSVAVPAGRSFVDQRVADHPYAKHYLADLPKQTSAETDELLQMAQAELDEARAKLADALAERDEAREQVAAMTDAIGMDKDSAAAKILAQSEQIVNLQRQLADATKKTAAKR